MRTSGGDAGRSGRDALVALAYEGNELTEVVKVAVGMRELKGEAGVLAAAATGGWIVVM